MIEARFTPFKKKNKKNLFLFSYQKSDLLCVLMFCVSPPPSNNKKKYQKIVAEKATQASGKHKKHNKFHKKSKKVAK